PVACYVCFFFQAEDGIRDKLVTGVQTCALPIYDSQFSVINWALSRVGLIGAYGSESWPIWLGQPHLALAACIAVNVWRTFPFSAIVLLAGFTAVPLEVIDAAQVDRCTVMQRLRHGV